MGKKTTSVYLDEDLYEKTEEDDHINRSALVNRFLRDYYSTGTAGGMQYRLRRVERELADAEEKVARLREERDQLKEQMQERNKDIESQLDEKMEIFAETDLSRITEDNEAIVNHAQDVGMTPSEFAEHVRERRRR